MKMQFNNLFTGKACPSRKPQHQRLIEHQAVAVHNLAYTARHWNIRHEIARGRHGTRPR